jgi:hypothetical protein
VLAFEGANDGINLFMLPGSPDTYHNFLKLAKFFYSNCKPNSRLTKAGRKSKEKQGTVQFFNGRKRTAYASTALSEFLNVIIEFQQSEVSHS